MKLRTYARLAVAGVVRTVADRLDPDRVTGPDDTVNGLRRQIKFYQVALETEKDARRRDRHAHENREDHWCEMWDRAASAVGLTSDELADKARARAMN